MPTPAPTPAPSAANLGNQRSNSIFQPAVFVAALGYFVDIYDLLMFSILRVPSLQSLGLSDAQIATEGLRIINFQMAGLLLGGILWGVLGDKRGRLKVLFASILLYSLGNLANAWVQTVDQYAWVRFISGIGLAGELGVGITLVAELLPKEKRGLGTSLVAAVGLSGAVAAFFMKEWLDWRSCYAVGGLLGLALLFLRIRVSESGMFQSVVQNPNVPRGRFLDLFRPRARAIAYLQSILIGLPTWYVIGILVSFSREFARDRGLPGEVDPGFAIMVAYAAISLGDLAIGFLSQALRSRKKALYIFYGITAAGLIFFFQAQSTTELYAACALLGFGTGFWALFVTMAAERFGTNLRATATTTIPNMVRGALVLISALFTALQSHFSYTHSGMLTGLVVVSLTAWAALHLPETFDRDLDFIES